MAILSSALSLRPSATTLKIQALLPKDKVGGSFQTCSGFRSKCQHIMETTAKYLFTAARQHQSNFDLKCGSWPRYFEKWYLYICAATLLSFCSWLWTVPLYSTACHAMSFFLPGTAPKSQRNWKPLGRCSHCLLFKSDAARLHSNSMKFTSQEGSWPSLNRNDGFCPLLYDALTQLFLLSS